MIWTLRTPLSTFFLPAALRMVAFVGPNPALAQIIVPGLFCESQNLVNCGHGCIEADMICCSNGVPCEQGQTCAMLGPGFEEPGCCGPDKRAGVDVCAGYPKDEIQELCTSYGFFPAYGLTFAHEPGCPTATPVGSTTVFHSTVTFEEDDNTQITWATTVIPEVVIPIFATSAPKTTSSSSAAKSSSLVLGSSTMAGVTSSAIATTASIENTTPAPLVTGTGSETGVSGGTSSITASGNGTISSPSPTHTTLLTGAGAIANAPGISWVVAFGTLMAGWVMTI